MKVAVATEVTDIDLGNWVFGAKFYSTDDGRHFVVDADLVDWGPGVTVVRRPTHVIYCDDRGGVADDLVPDFTFPPGTSHETAVTAAGFTLSS